MLFVILCPVLLWCGMNLQAAGPNTELVLSLQDDDAIEAELRKGIADTCIYLQRAQWNLKSRMCPLCFFSVMCHCDDFIRLRDYDALTGMGLLGYARRVCLIRDEIAKLSRCPRGIMLSLSDDKEDCTSAMVVCGRESFRFSLAITNAVNIIWHYAIQFPWIPRIKQEPLPTMLLSKDSTLERSDDSRTSVFGSYVEDEDNDRELVL